MRKLNLIYIVGICFSIFLSQVSVLYAQQGERTLFSSTWQTLSGNWINTPAVNSRTVIIRKDMQKETQWKNVSIDFRLDGKTNEKYMFGLVLNAKDASKFGLIRFFTVNNVTNLQVGVWEYGYFRAHLNTPIGNVITAGTSYKAVIEPNFNHKDWRPWSLKLINLQDGKILFERTLVNTMPLLGMGITGIYTEGARVDFLDFSVKIVPSVQVSNELRLAPLFKNGMVLQRDKKVAVWGFANPASEVTVSVAGVKYPAKTNSEGKWATMIGPLAATESTKMIISSGKSTITLTSVAVGEVWIASGQSNMEMRIWQADVGRKYGVKQDSGIRVFMQPGWPSEDPLFDSGGEWIRTDDPAFETSSAVAYSFASELRSKLKVPVGILCSYWGGTGAETWMPRDILRNDAATLPIIQDYQTAGVALEKRRKADVNQWFVPGQHKAPGALFNGMIAPHIPYGIRGAIWYQGESNADRAMQYRVLFPMLINSWRDAWNDPEMPFFFVQLPNYDGGQSGSEIENAWPEIREAQRLTLQKMTHAGMAITLELGNPKNIHPFLKKEVGLRLSRLALHDVYGFKNVIRSGPLFKSVQFDKEKALVHFDEIAKGLKAHSGEKLQGFVIAGIDKKFVLAQAVINKDGKSISVYADGVKNPVAIRYAWANNPEEANLINMEGLPASPFRTDDWKLFDK